MALNIYIDGAGKKQISVAGQLETKEEIQSLLRHMDSEARGHINIAFLDASIIHWSIVEKLAELQRQNRCSVFTFKLYLYSYLYKLGIRNKFVTKEKQHKDCIKAGEDQSCNHEPSKEEVIEFLDKLYKKYGYDYTQYQIESITRRIKISMIRQGCKDFQKFSQKVLSGYELFEQLFLDFSINTTEFFRNPEVFKKLREKVLPSLGHLSHIKIWCAGCSTGQEPYSIAILLDRLKMLDKCHIYATDINPYVIQEAKNGLYPLEGLEKSIANYNQLEGSESFMQYFTSHGEYVKVNKKLKDNILFFQHSLGGKGILNQFQLILCRNVLIYFNSELQAEILANFHNSLDTGGYLVLGKSEGILGNAGYRFFSPYSEQNKIFRPIA